MKHLATLVAIAVIAPCTQAQNSCSTAMPITAGTYSVDAVNGPEFPVPICANTGVGATHTEWYSYTPAEDHTLTVTTVLAQNVDSDTRIHIYEGSCGSLQCVGGADDQGSELRAEIAVQVVAGLSYRIAFDDRWSAAGFDFTLAEGPPVVVEFDFVAQPVPGGMGSECVVDMNGDRLDDIVSTSASMVTIQRQQMNGTFVTQSVPTPMAEHTASWSICAGDIDANGYLDLMYGGGQGASFMFAGPGGNSFTAFNPPEYIFCQRTNMVDIDSDGNLDAYSCHDVDANVRFMNDGNGNLTFSQGGLGETCGNYGSTWVDYDNDGDPDMFVAKCGCDAIDILMRNDGGGMFTNVAPELGLADGHQSWSSAWGDYDNDGDQDMLIGASGSPYHKLMRNNGNGTFTDATPGSGFEDHNGTSNEWMTHDFNNDGYLDVLGGGELMMGNGDLTFTPSTANAPYIGAVGDLNNDGFLDLVAGTQLYRNTGNSNRWLRVNLIGTESNRNGIGARIEVTTAMGTMSREVRSGDAFSPMSSLIAHFGLGSSTEIEQVTVRWPSGIVDMFAGIPINNTVDLLEGTGNVGVQEHAATSLNLFPNPVQEVLTIGTGTGLAKGLARVFDAAGKEVMTGRLDIGRLDVSALKPGIYTVQVPNGSNVVSARFTKH